MQRFDADCLADFVTQWMNWMSRRDHIFREADRKSLRAAEKSMCADGTALTEEIT
jgi:hypothetical protein